MKPFAEKGLLDNEDKLRYAPFVWNASMGSARLGSEHMQKNVLQKKSIWNFSAMRESPRLHGWLLFWNGQALALDSSTRWPVRSRDAGVRASTQKKNFSRQHAHTLRECSARTKSIQKLALCATSSFMLGEVTGPEVFLPGQSLPRTERLPALSCCRAFLCNRSIPICAVPISALQRTSAWARGRFTQSPDMAIPLFASKMERTLLCADMWRASLVHPCLADKGAEAFLRAGTETASGEGSGRSYELEKVRK